MALNLNKSDAWRKGCASDVVGFIILIISFNCSAWGWFLFGLFLIFIGIILNILGFVGRTIDVVCEFVYNGFLDLFGLRNEIKMRCPEAMKALIMSKRSNSVDVGIFNNASKQIQTMNIQSNSGVSNDLYVGQEIYLNN